MKRNLYLLLLVLPMIVFNACQKAEQGGTSDLQASQTGTISTNQSVLFSLASAKATDNVVWTAKPETVTITPSGNTAAVLFKAAGSYTITGTLGGISGSSTVTVKDTLVSNSLYKDVAFASGEQINITVSKMNDTLAKSGLMFVAQSTKKYNCRSTVRSTYAYNSSTNTLTINLNGVSEPTTPTCIGGTTDVFSGGVGNVQPIAAGTSVALVINFNGAAYSGTISKSAAGAFTITWGYTTGIVISPLSL